MDLVKCVVWIFCTVSAVLANRGYPTNFHNDVEDTSIRRLINENGLQNIEDLCLSLQQQQPKSYRQSAYIRNLPEEGGELVDYGSEEDITDYAEPERQVWHKRAAVSPFISLGALSNLPQFFEQLKASMDKENQAQAASAATSSATAAGECGATCGRQQRRPNRNHRSCKST